MSSKDFFGINLSLLLYTFILIINILWSGVCADSNYEAIKPRHGPMVPKPSIDINYEEFCDKVSYTCVGQYLPDGSYVLWYEKNDTLTRVLDVDNTDGATALNVKYVVMRNEFRYNVTIHCRATQNGKTIIKSKTITLELPDHLEESQRNCRNEVDDAQLRTLVTMLVVGIFNFLCLLIGCLACRECCKKRKSGIKSAQPGEEIPIYSYVPIDVLPIDELRELIAHNKALGPKSFVPAIHPRGHLENYA